MLRNTCRNFNVVQNQGNKDVVFFLRFHGAHEVVSF